MLLLSAATSSAKKLTMDDMAKVIEQRGTGDRAVKLEAALRATSHIQTTVQAK